MNQKYGVFFSNCSVSDINFIKYLYYKLLEETNIPIFLCDLQILDLVDVKHSTINKNVIVWFPVYELSYSFFCVFNLSTYKYLPYNFNLTKLDKTFTLMDINFIVNLFEGECCGIVLENRLMFTKQQIDSFHTKSIINIQTSLIEYLNFVIINNCKLLQIFF